MEVDGSNDCLNNAATSSGSGIRDDPCCNVAQSHGSSSAWNDVMPLAPRWRGVARESVCDVVERIFSPCMREDCRRDLRYKVFFYFDFFVMK